PWRGPALPVVVVAALLCLGIANISARATLHVVEDGVLWKGQPEGVIAADVAPGTGASAAGIRRGDVLIAIDGRPVQQVADVEAVLRGAEVGQSARYTILRLGTREVVDLRIAPIPSGPRVLYYLLSSAVEAVLRGAEVGQSARYTILLLGTREVVDLRIAPIPSGPRVLYYFLAAVGIFTLLIGAAVRLQRPRDPATLHFFLLPGRRCW